MSKRAFPTRRTDRSVSALFRGRQSKERQKKDKPQMPSNGKLLRETETKRTIIACETLTSLSVPYSFRNKVIFQFTPLHLITLTS